MSEINVDDILNQIDNIQTATESKKGGSSSKNFGDSDIVFLHGIRGKYEFRIFVDKDGLFSKPVPMHTIRGSNDKITTACKDKDCEICNSVKKLNQLTDNKGWRDARYDLYKILIKTGSIISLEDPEALKPNSVYVAYVNKKFIKSLSDSIKSISKYNKEELKAMSDYKVTSGGFIASAIADGKSTTFNFTFIPNMQIPPIDPVASFGSLDRMVLSALGPWDTSRINEEKFNKGLSIVNSKLAEAAGSQVTTPGSAQAEVQTSAPVQESAPQTQQTPAPQPTPVAEPKPVENVQVAPSTGTCQFNNFGGFDADKAECLKCPSRKECIMEQMS